ncbi:sugar ABC transporter ATP-binding protein [Niabella terrae]
MLTLKDIRKSFGGVKALQGVDLEVTAGEIHGVLGENGAGKSTLMKIISGALTADAGTLIFNKETIVHNSPQLAQHNGIRIIYQEFSLVPELSVAENIFLGSFSGAWFRREQQFREAASLIEKLGFEIDVTRKLRQLSVAHQQIVEIAKALSKQAKLLILDEPSAVLGSREIKKLFDLLRKLKQEGVAIIYISHHLDELFELTDRITILKEGKTVATLTTAQTNKDELVRLMVGRELSQMYPDKKAAGNQGGCIRVTNLKTGARQVPVSFSWNQGEILGIGGLVGSGRTELLEGLFGLQTDNQADVNVDDTVLLLDSPGRAISQGWGMVPEDRKKHGGLLDLSIRENISMANLKRICNRWGFIQQKKEKLIVQQLVERLQIKLGSIQDPLRSLSGGNQQKVVLAKWLHPSLKVLLIDEPTRGVDVGARAEIYKIIRELADRGIYILMVSSDMEELIGLSDRIMVMKGGKIQGMLEKNEISEEAVLRLAIAAN